MDVSNSNTPKSKIFTSQRKKLSDSFLKNEKSDDDDNKENLFELDQFIELKNSKCYRRPRNDTTDAGYQTGGATMSEESWSATSIFASTPTKAKN